MEERTLLQQPQNCPGECSPGKVNLRNGTGVSEGISYRGTLYILCKVDYNLELAICHQS